MPFKNQCFLTFSHTLLATLAELNRVARLLRHFGHYLKVELLIFANEKCKHGLFRSRAVPEYGAPALGTCTLAASLSPTQTLDARCITGERNEPKKRRTFVQPERKFEEYNGLFAKIRKLSSHARWRVEFWLADFGFRKKVANYPELAVRSGRSLYRTAVHRLARRRGWRTGQAGDGTLWRNGQSLHAEGLYSALQNNLLDINMLEIENLAKSSPNPRRTICVLDPCYSLFCV